MKKIISSLLLCLAAISFMSCMNNLGQAIMTTKKLNDGLYYMEIKGDDGVADFLSRGGASSAQDMGSYLSEFLARVLLRRLFPLHQRI